VSADNVVDIIDIHMLIQHYVGKICPASCHTDFADSLDVCSGNIAQKDGDAGVLDLNDVKSLVEQVAKTHLDTTFTLHHGKKIFSLDVGSPSADFQEMDIQDEGQCAQQCGGNCNAFVVGTPITLLTLSKPIFEEAPEQVKCFLHIGSTSASALDMVNADAEDTAQYDTYVKK